MGYRCMDMMWAKNPGVKGLRKEFPSLNSLSLGHSVWKGLYIMVVFSSLYIHFINACIAISLKLARLSRRALVPREVVEWALQPLMIEAPLWSSPASVYPFPYYPLFSWTVWEAGFSYNPQYLR